MMHDMMGAMGWGMGLTGLVGLVVLVLVIAALVKYVFFR
ncbi:putative membrane protein [Amorphus sp. MBR-141]